MEGSRFLNPTTPGGLLSPAEGNELTPQEELVIQAITAGSYFVFRETPAGAMNDSNMAFTLAHEPNPAASLCLFYNGQLLTLTTDYSLSGDDITLTFAPTSGDRLAATYTVDPN